MELARTHRRGQASVAALALGLAASVLVLVATQHRGRTSIWVRRVEAQLAGDDLLESAVEEAFHWVQLAANDPSSPVYRELREGGMAPRVLAGELAWSQGRLEQLGGAPALEVAVRVEDATSPDGDPASWSGRLVFEAHWGPRTRGRVHEVRVTRLTLPAPLDGACFHDWRFPQDGFPDAELWVDPAEFEALATLRVQPRDGETTQDTFLGLAGQLEALSGVVYVANGPGDPLTLRGHVHRGRTLLVVQGPLEMVDVTVEDPARDQLAVLALGDATLGGDLEAVVALTGSPDSPEATRQLLTGLDVEGAVVIASGTYRADRDTHVDCAPRPGTDAGGTVLEQVHVGISPDAVGGWDS